MRRSLAISLGVLLGCASAALLGWRPASAALSQTSYQQFSPMTADGGQPQIGQGESDAPFAEAGARHLPLLWEAGRMSTGDAGSTPAWEAGPTFARGDDGGL
jgi:hypothetical protein